MPIASSNTIVPTNHGQRRRRRGGPASSRTAPSIEVGSVGGAGIVGSVMSVTLLVALGVVVLSALVTAPMLFGRRPEPATVPVRSNDRGAARGAGSQQMPHAM